MFLKALRGVLSHERRLPLHVRPRHLVATFICSSAFYRLYGVANQQHSVSNDKSSARISTSVLSNFPYTVLCGEDRKAPSKDPVSKRDCESRADTLLQIKYWVENELPMIFQRGLFNSIDIFTRNTVLEFERFAKKPIIFRGSIQANSVLAAVRSVFAANYSGRRLEVLGLHVDGEAGEAEVSFRIVLIPRSTFAELRLPDQQRARRLEERATWLDFRAIFTVSKTGELIHVKLTQLNPGRSSFLEKSLRRLGVPEHIIRDTTRRLPQPLTAICSPADEISAQLEEVLTSLEVFFRKQELEAGVVESSLCHIDLNSVRNNTQSLELFHLKDLVASRMIQGPSVGLQEVERRQKRSSTALYACPFLLGLFSCFSQSLL